MAPTIVIFSLRIPLCSYSIADNLLACQFTLKVKPKIDKGIWDAHKNFHSCQKFRKQSGLKSANTLMKEVRLVFTFLFSFFFTFLAVQNSSIGDLVTH